MYTIEESTLKVLLNQFYSFYFVDYLESLISDDEEGKQIHDNLRIKYSKEVKDYHDNGKSFEEEHGELDFFKL